MSAEVVKLASQDKDKNVALESAIGQIEKAFGKGSVMKLGKAGENLDIQAISTGSLGLDVALGIGGLPKGRIVEIYGPESSGKTTSALHVVAESQKKRWYMRFCRCRTRPRSSLCQKIGCEYR
jgi:recombination protein RecA